MVSPRVIEYHHVTHNISRANQEAARRFYRDMLGLEEIPSFQDPTGERLIWFSVGGQRQLHLVKCDAPDLTSSRHLAVLVDAFDGMVARLRAHGVRMDECEPGQFWGLRANGLKYAFCYDPDGNRIELMENPA